MSRVVELVLVGHQPHWGKWPDTQDKNFQEVLSWRVDRPLVIRGEPLTLRLRWYPVYLPFVKTGLEPPIAHPGICNLLLPPQAVLEVMLRDLETIAAEGCHMIYWEHARHCYPPVARHLRRLFRHSILVNADDCPGSTESRTAPVAGFFDSALVGNVIWREEGEFTAALYHRMGVPDVHYLALNCTGGFPEGLAAAGFTLDGRVSQLRRGDYDHDLVFVGGLMGHFRPVLNATETTQAFAGAGLRTRVVGAGMRDGQLLPRASAPGGPVAALYLRAFAVFNCPFIGLISTRAFDAWRSGTLLVQHDPVGELASLGVLPGVHYADYDGSVPGLIRTVRHYQSQLDETEAILRAGYAIAGALPEEYNVTRAMERILDSFWEKWRLT